LGVLRFLGNGRDLTFTVWTCFVFGGGFISNLGLTFGLDLVRFG
jgi:hypothetical protein